MGMSLVVSINFLVGGVLSLVLPLIVSPYILLGTFAGTNALAWILVYCYVREPEKPTDGGSESSAMRMEEVFEIYQPKHTEHIKFQWAHRKDALYSVLDFILWRETPPSRRHFFIDSIET